MYHKVRKINQVFNYEEVIGYLNNIEIRKEGGEVVTYYDKKQVARKVVSDRYEIFDFKPFITKCINEISEKFEIASYDIYIIGGLQEIRLYSEEICVSDEKFRKVFYLLNSSDKSRALNMSYGISFCDNAYHYITKKGSLVKRHYKGITDLVNERVDLDDAPFNEIIETLDGIIGHSIRFSNVVKIILDGKDINEASVTNLKRLEKFIGRIRYRSTSLDKTQLDMLPRFGYGFSSRVFIDRISKMVQDPIFDSYEVFKTYMRSFVGEDCVTIKRESDKIKNLTIYKIRKDNIDKILEMCQENG